MSGSSNLNSFRDRGQVAVQLVSSGVLPPGWAHIHIYVSLVGCFYSIQTLVGYLQVNLDYTYI